MNGSKEKTIVCIAGTDILSDECLFNAFYGRVSEERRRKTDAYRFEKDRRLSLGAEVLLYASLEKFGYDRPDRVSFAYGENNKPYIGGDGNIFFNLSHSGEYVMCAVSDREVGCDIQKMGDDDTLLAKKFFLPREYETIAAQPTEHEKRDMFYRYWTLKESYMKVTGKGMSMPLDGFEITVSDKAYLTKNPCGGKYYFSEYDAPDGYKSALCIADRPCTALPEFINLKGVTI